MDHAQWARGLVITTSGLAKKIKDQVERCVEAAGGRYSAALTRKVTHVVLDPDLVNPRSGTEKLRTIDKDRSSWKCELVALEWVVACKEVGRRVDVSGYLVLNGGAGGAEAQSVQQRDPAQPGPGIARANGAMRMGMGAHHAPTGQAAPPPTGPTATSEQHSAAPWVVHYSQLDAGLDHDAHKWSPLRKELFIEEEGPAEGEDSTGCGSSSPSQLHDALQQPVLQQRQPPVRWKLPLGSEEDGQASRVLGAPVGAGAQQHHAPARAPWRMYASQADPGLAALAGPTGPANPWRLQPAETVPEEDPVVQAGALDDVMPQPEPHQAMHSQEGHPELPSNGPVVQMRAAAWAVQQVPAAGLSQPPPAPEVVLPRGAWVMEHSPAPPAPPGSAAGAPLVAAVPGPADVQPLHHTAQQPALATSGLKPQVAQAQALQLAAALALPDSQASQPENRDAAGPSNTHHHTIPCKAAGRGPDPSLHMAGVSPQPEQAWHHVHPHQLGDGEDAHMQMSPLPSQLPAPIQTQAQLAASDLVAQLMALSTHAQPQAPAPRTYLQHAPTGHLEQPQPQVHTDVVHVIGQATNRDTLRASPAQAAMQLLDGAAKTPLPHPCAQPATLQATHPSPFRPAQAGSAGTGFGGMSAQELLSAWQQARVAQAAAAPAPSAVRSRSSPSHGLPIPVQSPAAPLSSEHSPSCFPQHSRQPVTQVFGSTWGAVAAAAALPVDPPPAAHAQLPASPPWLALNQDTEHAALPAAFTTRLLQLLPAASPDPEHMQLPYPAVGSAPQQQEGLDDLITQLQQLRAARAQEVAVAAAAPGGHAGSAGAPGAMMMQVSSQAAGSDPKQPHVPARLFANEVGAASQQPAEAALPSSDLMQAAGVAARPYQQANALHAAAAGSLSATALTADAPMAPASTQDAGLMSLDALLSELQALNAVGEVNTAGGVLEEGQVPVSPVVQVAEQLQMEQLQLWGVQHMPMDVQQAAAVPAPGGSRAPFLDRSNQPMSCVSPGLQLHSRGAHKANKITGCQGGEGKGQYTPQASGKQLRQPPLLSPMDRDATPAPHPQRHPSPPSTLHGCPEPAPMDITPGPMGAATHHATPPVSLLCLHVALGLQPPQGLTAGGSQAVNCHHFSGPSGQGVQLPDGVATYMGGQGPRGVVPQGMQSPAGAAQQDSQQASSGHCRHSMGPLPSSPHSVGGALAPGGSLSQATGPVPGVVGSAGGAGAVGNAGHSQLNAAQHLRSTVIASTQPPQHASQPQPQAHHAHELGAAAGEVPQPGAACGMQLPRPEAHTRHTPHGMTTGASRDRPAGSGAVCEAGAAASEEGASLGGLRTMLHALATPATTGVPHPSGQSPGLAGARAEAAPKPQLLAGPHSMHAFDYAAGDGDLDMEGGGDFEMDSLMAVGLDGGGDVGMEDQDASPIPGTPGFTSEEESEEESDDEEEEEDDAAAGGSGQVHGWQFARAAQSHPPLPGLSKHHTSPQQQLQMQSQQHSQQQQVALHQPEKPLSQPPAVLLTTRSSPGTWDLSTLRGMAVVVDPQLPAGPAADVRAAVQAAGATQQAQWFLGSGAACVVCEPGAAHTWLARGLHVVSPDWVLRAAAAAASGKSGGGPPPPPRVLGVSADILRHVHRQLGAAAAGNVSVEGGAVQQGVGGEGAAGPGAGAGCSGAGGEGAQGAELQLRLGSRKGRQQVLKEIKGREHGGRTRTLGQQLAQPGPAVLLEHIAWRVDQDPGSACMYRDEGEEEGEGQEAGGQVAAAQNGGAGDGLYSVGSVLEYSQLPGALGGGRQRNGAGDPSVALLTPQQMAEVVFKGTHLTLLLPKDELGLLGYDVIVLPVPPAGLTVGALLAAVHEHYGRQLSCAQQVEAMGVHAHVRRALQAGFLEGRPVARSCLLGPRRTLDGLVRVSRGARPAAGAGGCVYELQLVH